ncbi:MAG: hypothetical protein LBT56_00755 [Prevotellaceae bacterium]|jgi:hypothetical protein|nr:hypothetical protein [Prevotellaceae bacterium]
MKNKKVITDNKNNPVRDYRLVEMLNTTPTMQSVRTATKKAEAANLTACYFENNLL